MAQLTQRADTQRPYTRPELTRFGKIADLTAGGTTGVTDEVTFMINMGMYQSIMYDCSIYYRDNTGDPGTPAGPYCP